jgi:hypothetical protein
MPEGTSRRAAEAAGTQCHPEGLLAFRARLFVGQLAIAAAMNNSRSDDVRLRLPDRRQMVMWMQSPDDLLDAEHPVPVVWRVVCSLDLGRFYEPIKARGAAADRDATDPRLLVALRLRAATGAAPASSPGSARSASRTSGCAAA